VKLRLTRTGRGIAVGGAALTVLGLWLVYPELLALAAAAVLALAAGWLWLLRRPTLDVRRDVEPERVARGEPALGLVEVTNAGRSTAAAFAALDRVGPDEVRVEVPALAAGQHHIATYRLPTNRRGVFPVGPLMLAQSDPLAVLERTRNLGKVRTLRVHPRIHPVKLPPVALARDLEGPAAEAALEGGAVFHGLREYVYGDDLRQVHWRTTARTGTLMVRVHVDTSRPETLVLLDDRPETYADGNDFEAAVEFAASLAVATVQAGFPVRLELVSRRPEVAGLSQDVRAHLDGLAELTPYGDAEPRPLPAALVELARTTSGSCACLVGGDLGPDDVARLAILRERYRVVRAALVTERLGADSGRLHGIDMLAGATGIDLAAAWNRW
jgi:uncharacterized protein (DUF58 family)